MMQLRPSALDREFPVRGPVIRHLLRAHPGDHSELSRDILHIVREHGPGDGFALAQWKIGLPYFSRRFEAVEASGALLLDLGCATGNWSIAAAPYFGRVIGFEYGGVSVACATRVAARLGASNVSFVQADIRSVPYPGGAADWVLLYNVLPCLADWPRALAESARLLRPGGTLWLAWNDSGMLPYMLAEGMMLRIPGYLRDAGLRLLGNVCSPLRSLGSGPAWYLPAREVQAEIEKCGLVPFWRSWTDRWPAGLNPTFPWRFAGLPFFRELLALKP